MSREVCTISSSNKARSRLLVLVVPSMYLGARVIYTDCKGGKNVGGFFAEVPENSLTHCKLNGIWQQRGPISMVTIDNVCRKKRIACQTVERGSL